MCLTSSRSLPPAIALGLLKPLSRLPVRALGLLKPVSRLPERALEPLKPMGGRSVPRPVRSSGPASAEEADGVGAGV